ncbi:ABC transporter ATP-binding protein [Couchioplanes azureus]|uniref:ABC transporter ATP-binding protein n=1 Tax=Couchioplanes caeruleus TaxID=56438 RepID=UPI00167135E1|nr:ABC transporter ATP-binding protein [Couchioplanes caeruleus]GGQ52652.1 multidrug ABC transporter ATP-binding protein [Couchioplanes caeruleus subsp. azureus]
MEGHPEPPENHLAVAGPAQLRRAARHLIRADRASVVWMLLLNGSAALAALAGPWLLGRIIDTVADATRNPATSAGALTTINWLALSIVFSAGLQILLSRSALLIGFRFGERTAARVREQAVDRALGLPASLVERTSPGDITARVVHDVSEVARILRDGIPEVLVAAVQAVLILVLTFFLDPLLGACGIVGMTGIVFVSRWYLRRARTAYLAEGTAGSAITDVLVSTSAGARTVDAFGLEQQRRAVADRAVDDGMRTRMRTLSLRSVLYPVVDSSYVIAVVGVLIVGGLLYHRGAVTLGVVTASALYLRQLSVPLDLILTWMESLQSGGAAFARVEGVRGAETPYQVASEPVGDRIEISNVHYAYGTGRDVLNGVNLDVRPGERLAIVGSSGAGKSTLGRLVAGVDAPRAGTITVGGVPVSSLPAEKLRRHVILVTQDHHVFRESLRDNLLLAAPDAGDADLLTALEVVGADWAGELPDGLDTTFGEEVTLDDAQAQQLSLARVVLADPHTVILDEATASLDPITARHTERALSAVLRNRTVIAIAHRLQTARDADRIVVMDSGRVSEVGSHEELVREGGAYAALWESWHGPAGAARVSRGGPPGR